jgi:hypothetical protein
MLCTVTHSFPCFLLLFPVFNGVGGVTLGLLDMVTDIVTLSVTPIVTGKIRRQRWYGKIAALPAII